MEPNRTEQEFKRKLDERTIQPSAGAWDRLDAMLSVAEKKESRPKRRWLYIAAGFAGFLLAGTLYLKMETATPDATIINTDTPVVTTAPSQPEGQQQSVGAQKEAPVQNPLPEKVQESAVPVSPKRYDYNKGVAATKTVQPKTKAATPDSANTAEVNDQKIQATPQGNEMIAQNSNVPQKTIAPEKNTITVDADLLLASVDKSDKKNRKEKLKIKTTQSITVDTRALLSSADPQPKDNFREQVLEKAVKNFNSIKNSVANRNYQ